jgi:hypothetical protein
MVGHVPIVNTLRQCLHGMRLPRKKSKEHGNRTGESIIYLGRYAWSIMTRQSIIYLWPLCAEHNDVAEHNDPWAIMRGA